MFPRRYFAAVYFAPRYFPQSSGQMVQSRDWFYVVSAPSAKWGVLAPLAKWSTGAPQQ